MAVLYTLAFICAWVVAYPAEANEAQLAAASRQQRQAGGGRDHDAVDFGAHTGDHGAFGWYADFPVHAHAD